MLTRGEDKAVAILRGGRGEKLAKAATDAYDGIVIGMSTFDDSELEALDNTAEMIRGYIKSMEANHKRIPLSANKLAQLKRLVGIR